MNIVLLLKVLLQVFLSLGVSPTCSKMVEIGDIFWKKWKKKKFHTVLNNRLQFFQSDLDFVWSQRSHDVYNIDVAKKLLLLCIKMYQKPNKIVTLLKSWSIWKVSKMESRNFDWPDTIPLQAVEKWLQGG